MSVEEQQATNTSAGTFTSGSFITRALNTVVRNVISGASLASNKITLPAGTYAVAWGASANEVAAHATRLFNVTDSAVIATGTAEQCPAASAVTTRSISPSTAVFTLSSAKDIRLEHQCGTTKSSTGLGLATNIGAHEVYSWVNIWKTA